MNLDSKLFDLIFRQVSPDRIARNLSEASGGAKKFLMSEPYDVFNDSSWFIEYAESTLSGYTNNEQNLLCQMLPQKQKRWTSDTQIETNPLFAFVFQYVSENLTLSGSEPVCKEASLLEWREKFLRLGQDLFVCAFFAVRDFLSDTDSAHTESDRTISDLTSADSLRPNQLCTDFSWPAIIRMEHPAEEKKDIAENHNHLGGGTFGYQVTWVREMNFPGEIRKELTTLEKTTPLFAKMIRRSEDYTMDYKDRLELAALIRSILFRALNRNAFGGSFDSEETFTEEYLRPFSKYNVLIDSVDNIRAAYGARVNYPDYEGFCLDYCMDEKHLQDARMNPHLRALVGERVFLYECFKACMQKKGTDRKAEFTHFEQELFYLYLVLQTNFRSEIIQANQQTGFDNFREYQNRKDDAWDGNPYFWEAARIALNYRFHHENISALEGRNAPKSDPSKIIQKILRYDNAYLLAEQEAALKGNPLFLPLGTMLEPEVRPYSEADFEEAGLHNFFYVYHFIKLPDKTKLKKGAFQFQPVCRHESRRDALEGDAMALADALKTSDYFRSRFRGIDAANSEFGCRPEVFAVAYRYMENTHDVNKTFHAGEDFEDIADGLRYIDEAMEYLFLRKGPKQGMLESTEQDTQQDSKHVADPEPVEKTTAQREKISRIGHALALGTEPKDHYGLKNYEIVTTKQDRLDDLVWMLYRWSDMDVFGYDFEEPDDLGDEYETPVPENYKLEREKEKYQKLKAKLWDEAIALISELYGDVWAARSEKISADSEKVTADMESGRATTVISPVDYNQLLSYYYLSMRLRGDDPRLYKTGSFVDTDFTVREIEKSYFTEDSSEYQKRIKNSSLPLQTTQRFQTLSDLRRDPLVSGLYHAYHYNVDIRNKGKETYVFQADKTYASYMRLIQDALMRQIADEEICIECNLSSNVLIGTFKDYKKHPIYRFHSVDGNKKIHADGSVLPDLKVSLNTDDLGVFDTSLIFEYDLIYAALKEMETDDGLPLYTETQIRNYIENLKKMGVDMTFPKIK